MGGGAGGGAISIEADGNGTLTILSGVTISANGGANSQKDTNDRNGGGGSGGSLRFVGKSIINNGTISAVGGTGTKLPSGGGGRVSFSYSFNLTKGTVNVGSGSYAGTINESTKPIIVDGDTGGIPEHFVFSVKTFERLGVSALVIEDKVGLKRNSLYGDSVPQTQDDPDKFAMKIKAGKQAQVTEEFMIIARVESMILGKGIDDAIMRSKTYIAAGADAVMLHYKSKDPADYFELTRRYAELDPKVPLVVVPSTFSHVPESELQAAGANIVIYANHLLRSAYPAMVHTAETILRSGRAHEVEEQCLSIKDVLALIPGV